MNTYELKRILPSPFPAKADEKGNYTQQYTIQIGLVDEPHGLVKSERITITYNENDSTKRIGELATEAANKLVNEKYNGNQ
jgi:hypothetical protein